MRQAVAFGRVVAEEIAGVLEAGATTGAHTETFAERFDAFVAVADRGLHLRFGDLFTDTNEQSSVPLLFPKVSPDANDYQYDYCPIDRT